MTDNVEIFVRQVRNRSQEHLRAFDLVYGSGLYGQCISILRQELDSMVRVIYLLSQPIDRRNELISMSVDGKQWTRQNSKRRLTDFEMVSVARELHGWTRSVYLFGCAFIHLSNLHDYNDRDPYLALPEGKRLSILKHCRDYHSAPTVEHPTAIDFIPILPEILKKITSNLGWYLECLEKNEQPNTLSL